jgi:sugar phosphate permease
VAAQQPDGGPRYRWVVLAVGAFGAAAFTGLRMGFPALGPELRSVFGLSLGEVGLALAALSVGVTVTTVPWGMLTDRVGERPVLAGGLLATSVALAGIAFTDGFPALLLGLLIVGAFGASSTGASGRAIMGWFTRHERGFALGIRQMALPVGGALGSIALPLLADAGGLQAAFLASAGLVLTAAVTAAVFMRDAPPAAPGAHVVDAPKPLRDPRILRLGLGSGLLVCAQAAILGFLVLFLHDELGLSAAFAAALLAALQLVGAAARIVAGRRSDREERRIQPMRRHALAAAALLVASAALTPAPAWIVVPLVMVAGVSTMAWNGLAFTAAAEMSGREQAGTAMSVQNTMTSVGTVVAPVAFGAFVEVTSWSPAFVALAACPLAAWWVLTPLVAEEERRADAREARMALAARVAAAQEAEPSATAS